MNMDISSMKGGAEGAFNVMEMQRMAQAENQAGAQDQNRLARPEPQAGVKTETPMAVQGLGENLDVMV